MQLAVIADYYVLASAQEERTGWSPSFHPQLLLLRHRKGSHEECSSSGGQIQSCNVANSILIIIRPGLAIYLMYSSCWLPLISTSEVLSRHPLVQIWLLSKISIKWWTNEFPGRWWWSGTSHEMQVISSEMMIGCHSLIGSPSSYRREIKWPSMESLIRSGIFGKLSHKLVLNLGNFKL